jgi:hypothetical protein
MNDRAEIVPLTLAEARRYVAEHHRHNEPPIGHRFSIGLRRGRAIEEAWCRETSGDPDGWSPDNPAWGQCAVTALVIQDEMGGSLLRTTVGGVSHYLNDVGGERIDRTLVQFAGAAYDDEPVPREREYVLSFPATASRYALLRDRMTPRLVGVVIAGHPVARKADDGRTIELVRLTTEGDRNACSRLYSAACRAAFAMGYLRVITYTLEDEPGSSLRAAGFSEDALLGERGEDWTNRPGRAAELPRLFDPPKMPTGPKRRWVRAA